MKRAKVNTNGLTVGRFPDPHAAGEDGLLCIGGDLSVETLCEAYLKGIFPWPQKGLPLLWFSPAQRGVLDFSELHWPRRFRRELLNKNYSITFNKAFALVIRECAMVPRKVTPEAPAGTWILPAMERAYIKFHEAGYAHSVECWQNETELVGGLYGVYIGGVFSGESMFFKASNASKRCLYALCERLAESGLSWMDIQMVTPVLQTFGGKYVTRDEFLQRVETAHQVMNKQKLVL